MPNARIRKGRRKNLRMVRKIKWARKRLSASRPSYGNILSKRLLANMKMNTLASLNPAAGAIATYDVCANFQLDDPTGTGSTDQPRGYDQLLALYGTWTIIGSRIKVRFIVNPSATVTPMVGITLFKGTPQTDPGNLTTIDDYKESKFTRLRILPVGDTTGVVTMNYRYSPKKVLGHKQEVAEEALSFSGSADNAYSYRIFVFPADESGDISAVTVQVQTEYLVVWSNPQNPPASVQ